MPKVSFSCKVLRWDSSQGSVATKSISSSLGYTAPHFPILTPRQLTNRGSHASRLGSESPTEEETNKKDYY